MEETRHHHEHYSQRSGHNRMTNSQKKRKIVGRILFSFLCVIAAIIMAIIAYDHIFGLF